MTLTEIEKKALNEIRDSLKYSLDSIDDLLNNWNSDEFQESEIKTLIRDWSNITYDQFGYLERLGVQNGSNLQNLIILQNFLIKESKN